MLGVLLFAAFSFWILYRLWTQVYTYWKSRGFPHIPGEFPFGSSKELVTFSKYQGFIMKEYYNIMRDQPFYGIYFVRSPQLVVHDPEMIRLVLTKDFSYFRDRQDFQRDEKEFLAQHLFNLDGDRWRTLRVKMTPTFTSGKLKAMFPLFVNCADELNKMLLTRLEKVVDIKDITSSFTADTICSCAFGLEMNAISDPNSKFKQLGVDFFQTKTSTIVKNAIMNFIPAIKKYPFRFTAKYMEDYILGLIKETVEYRKTKKIKRNDFLEMLIEMNQNGWVGEGPKDESQGDYGTAVEMSYEMMSSQCFVFFVAGFETAGAVQSYCLYEMALNQDMQDKLHDEIEKTIESHGGLTYQAINEMSYLEKVVSETMRKYPTLPILTRMCTKKYRFPTGHIVEEGTKILIPVYALHHDPAFFPEPQKFDPERFAPHNKESIKPYTYMPFGEGPRLCIGMRFGLLQAKMGLITILRKYRVEKAESTPVPIKFRGTQLISTTAGPLQLKITARD